MARSASGFRSFRAFQTVAIAGVTLLLGAFITVGGGAATASADGGTASVSGTVTGSGSPLADVEVDITSQDGSYFDSTDTATDGSYTLATIPAGSYTLSYQPAEGTNFIPQWWNDQASQNSATYFDVADGQVLTGYDAELAAGATIAGNVDGADAPGVGLANVDVTAQSADGSVSVDDQTDASGNYSLVGLPAGSYTVQFQPSGSKYIEQYYDNEATAEDADPITVSAGSSTTGINAHLVVGAKIKGTVTSASPAGTPVSGVTVTAFGPGELTIQSAKTNSSGGYTITGLPAASYVVEFQAPAKDSYGTQYWQNANTRATATPVALTTSQVATGINASLAAGASVSGTVYAPGTSQTPLAQASVSIYAAAGGGPVANTTTNKSGQYSFAGLAAGSYTVSFAGPNAALEWWGGSFIQTGAQTLTVSAGQSMAGVSQQLVVGSKVTGTIQDAGTTPTPDAYVDVTLWASDQVQGSSANPPKETNTDASGKYFFSNVGPGTYTVLFGEEGADFLSQWWKNKQTQAKATQLVVQLNKAAPGIGTTLAVAVITPGTPTVTGVAKVGSTLTAKTGSWKPNSIVFTYQWLRNGTAIAKATSATYVPTTADVGDTLTVAVTGTIPAAQSQGKSDTETSAATKAVVS